MTSPRDTLIKDLYAKLGDLFEEFKNDLSFFRQKKEWHRIQKDNFQNLVLDVYNLQFQPGSDQDKVKAAMSKIKEAYDESLKNIPQNPTGSMYPNRQNYLGDKLKIMLDHQLYKQYLTVGPKLKK